MVSKVDQSVGDVMAALRTKGMLHNSIVLFMSDNGAPTFGVHSNRGSNFPLKGVIQNEHLGKKKIFGAFETAVVV
jgi:arylsulfatase A-like enzyme